MNLPKEPFISHATKNLELFEKILQLGKIYSSEYLIKNKLIEVKDSFHSQTIDAIFGKNKFVNMSIGAGYLISNKMPCAFFFSTKAIKNDSQFHR